MATALHTSEDDAESMLGQLGLDSATLREVCRRGVGQFLTATPHHPRNAGGSFLYFELVRSLRDLLSVSSWETCEDGLSLVFNEERRIAIAVFSGDGNTAKLDAVPWFRYERGQLTYAAIAGNANQLGLFDARPEFAHLLPLMPRKLVDFGSYRTWCLLHFVDVVKSEFRVELSLPVGTNEQGDGDPWEHRIILDTVPFDDQPEISRPGDGPQGPELDIPIRKKA